MLGIRMICPVASDSTGPHICVHSLETASGGMRRQHVLHEKFSAIGET